MKFSVLVLRLLLYVSHTLIDFKGHFTYGSDEPLHLFLRYFYHRRMHFLVLRVLFVFDLFFVPKRS
jgi:hypothetical protein